MKVSPDWSFYILRFCNRKPEIKEKSSNECSQNFDLNQTCVLARYTTFVLCFVLHLVQIKYTTWLSPNWWRYICFWLRKSILWWISTSKSWGGKQLFCWRHILLECTLCGQFYQFHFLVLITNHWPVHSVLAVWICQTMENCNKKNNW